MLYYFGWLFIAKPRQVRGAYEGKPRFRKPQVTGSNPVVGSSLGSQQSGVRSLARLALAQADCLTQINFVASDGLAVSLFRLRIV